MILNRMILGLRRCAPQRCEVGNRARPREPAARRRGGPQAPPFGFPRVSREFDSDGAKSRQGGIELVVCMIIIFPGAPPS